MVAFCLAGIYATLMHTWYIFYLLISLTICFFNALKFSLIVKSLASQTLGYCTLILSYTILMSMFNRYRYFVVYLMSFMNRILSGNKKILWILPFLHVSFNYFIYLVKYSRTILYKNRKMYIFVLFMMWKFLSIFKRLLGLSWL